MPVHAAFIYLTLDSSPSPVIRLSLSLSLPLPPSLSHTHAMLSMSIACACKEHTINENIKRLFQLHQIYVYKSNHLVFISSSLAAIRSFSEFNEQTDWTVVSVMFLVDIAYYSFPFGTLRILHNLCVWHAQHSIWPLLPYKISACCWTEMHRSKRIVYCVSNSVRSTFCS